ncbi:MAG: hypothetical protein ACKPJN_00955, partial [Microcystis panniformis]
ELQSSLESKIKQFEEERTMPLMSNMELRGIERGKEIGEEIGELRGIEQGKEIGALEKARNYVKTVLKTRLGDIPIDIEQAVDKIAVLSILDELLKSALTVNSFDELHQLL